MLRGRFHVASLVRKARASVKFHSTLRQESSLSRSKQRLGLSLQSSLKTRGNAMATSAATAAHATKLPVDIPYKGLASWMFGCSGMVFGMVVVGGSTRLLDRALDLLSPGGLEGFSFVSGGRRRGLGKTFVGRGGVRVGAVRGWYGL